MLAKTDLRTIRKSLGRYLAVLSIIALGVGFFAGLRVTKESMVSTLDGYLGELEFYDLKLMSTLGLTEDDVKAFSELDGVKTAAGSVSADFIYVAGDGSDAVLHAHTVLDGMNKLDIVSGKYPEKADECVVDSKLSGTVKIGDKIEFSKLTNLQEKLLVDVVELYRENTFENLFRKLYTNEEEIMTKTKAMYNIYSPEKEQQYGVLGIKIKICRE